MDEPALNQDEIDSLLGEFGGDTSAPAEAPADAAAEVSDEDMSALFAEPAAAAPTFEAPPAAATPVAPAMHAEPAGAAAEYPQKNIDVLLDVPLEVIVELGKTEMQIKDILEIAPGSIVELERLSGEPVDILVNGKLVARGEVVVVDENFGVKLIHIVSPMERLAQLR
ncbi:MAG: flagellar motor switch protein FliN [bacterium]